MKMSSARKIVCLLTGSAESTAAALLAKRQGYNVSGAFINSRYLTHEENYAQRRLVQLVCDRLHVPFHDVTLPSEAWEPLEKEMRQEYSRGGSPDVAVLYNRHILFGSAYQYVMSVMQAAGMTTGHYARSSLPPLDWNRHPHHSVQLRRSVDVRRDDTLLISQIPQKCLQSTMFPLGEMVSEALPVILNSAGIDISDAKEKDINIYQRISDHVLKHMPKKPGSFQHLETKKAMKNFKNIHSYHIGQRVRVGRRELVVCSKDYDSNIISLVSSTDHPALVSHTFFVSLVHWIWQVPYNFYEKGIMTCEFALSPGAALTPCTLTVGMNNEYCGNDHVIVSTVTPTGPIAPGRYCAIYQGEHCMGSGKVLHAGPSEYAMNYAKYSNKDASAASTWSALISKIKRIF